MLGLGYLIRNVPGLSFLLGFLVMILVFFIFKLYLVAMHPIKELESFDNTANVGGPNYLHTR